MQAWDSKIINVIFHSKLIPLDRSRRSALDNDSKMARRMCKRDREPSRIHKANLCRLMQKRSKRKYLNFSMRHFIPRSSELYSFRKVQIYKQRRLIKIQWKQLLWQLLFKKWKRDKRYQQAVCLKKVFFALNSQWRNEFRWWKYSADISIMKIIHIQSNLGYPDLDCPDFSIIRTFSVVPIWSWVFSVTIKIRSHMLFKTAALKSAIKCEGFALSKSRSSARACRS